MTQLSLVHRTHAARTESPPHPGIILLHGLGSNELDLLALAPELDPRLFAISVRAPLTYQWGGYMWFDMERHGPGLGSESIESSLATLLRLIDEVSRAFPIDPKRLYFGGFSMGAVMAGALALLEPERVAGALMLSGWLPPDTGNRYRSDKADGHPLFVGHGTMDQVVPIEAARQTRAVLESMPLDVTYKEYPIAHEVSAQELRDVARWFHVLLGDEVVQPREPL